MMMKKSWFAALALCCTVLAAASCTSDDNEVVVDEAWKEANQVAFRNLSDDDAYREILSQGNNGSVYIKVLKEGNGTAPIYYNSVVKAYYTGSFINGTVFDSAEPPYDTPYELSVNKMIEGWGVALPHMKAGDRWEIWIPYQLAYGAYGNANQNTGVVSIPPYSTLKFEVEIVEII